MGVPVRALYERNNVAIRALEGMEETVGFYHCDGLDEHPSITEAEICENGIYYNVDFINGQKTGFFLDQKYNRLAAAKLARGRTVLDCFTHTGSFALNAAKAGAAHVDAVDISADAIAMTRRNAERNGVQAARFLCADAGEAACQLRDEGIRPDVVVIDPPRKGCTPDVIRTIVEMAPSRVVYVSCDPATLARDLKLFDELGYTTETVTPVDMFPRPAHVETVVRLSRKG
jgi:tRNA/tmRNA/rRNA uracil-C5-methylase (TrmA/RlmC/RlmD family)